MSNKCQSNKTMTFVKVKHCDVIVLVLAAILAAAILPTIKLHVDCAKLEPQIKLLINDDDLLLQQHHEQQQQQQQGIQQQNFQHSAVNEHDDRFNLYHSELKRLSYETIHRILRDENEPIFRREDTELRYFQKRSFQPTHEVVRRSAPQDKSIELPRYLNLAGKNLTVFNITEKWQQLTEIDLSRNKISSANLTSLPQLRVADLSHNLFVQLPNITEHKNLIALNLNANRIKSGVAPANQKLSALHLSSNEIESLAALNLSQLTALETLDLSCNHIRSLHTTFFPERMHNLKHLSLAHNDLSAVYRETFYNLISLNTLLLTQNNISDIDYETLLALPNLQFLDLSYNKLNGDSIRALQGIPDLVGLSIAYNTEVGGSLQEFVASWSLKELDASGTGLCQIPAALAQSVRTLKLTDNWLKVINCGDLDSYPLLQYLDLSYSHIDDIEDDALGRLEMLEILFLDHNNLRKIPISLPTTLEHLFLQNNQIMDIQSQAFQGLNNLQTLDLSGNQLLYFPALPLPKLLTLNLQSSGLKGVNQAIVHTLPRLRDLLLEDNPIKCSDLLSIAEWASPCRLAERSSGGGTGGGFISSNSASLLSEQIGSEEMGQQQQLSEQQQLFVAAKIDLKQKFVQMHNFFEKFKSNCGIEKQKIQNALVQEPPACATAANEMVVDKNAEKTKETKKVEEKQQQQSLQHATIKPLKSAMPSENSKAKVHNFNQKMLGTVATATTKLKFRESLKQATKYHRVAETTTKWMQGKLTIDTDEPGVEAEVAATQITIAAIMQNNNNTEQQHYSPSSQHKFSAISDVTTEEQAAEISSETKMPSLQQFMQIAATTSTLEGNQPTTTFSRNLLQQNNTTKSSLQQEFTTTITAQTITSLNYNEKISNVGSNTTASATPPTPATSFNASSLTFHVPQIVSTTIKSNNNNNKHHKYHSTDAITQSSLLNNVAAGFIGTTPTTSAGVTTATDVPTSTTIIKDKDLRQNANNNISSYNNNNNQNVEMPNQRMNRSQQQNGLKRAQLNLNGISGQQNIGKEPTKINITATTIATAATSDVLQQTLTAQHEPTNSFSKILTNAQIADQTTTPTAPITTNLKPTTHKHEPLQLHIKDRHLIGTPLLMHNGENILVETEQLRQHRIPPTISTTANALSNKAITTPEPPPPSPPPSLQATDDKQTSNKNMLAGEKHILDESQQLKELKKQEDDKTTIKTIQKQDLKLEELQQNDKETRKTETKHEKYNKQNGNTLKEHIAATIATTAIAMNKDDNQQEQTHMHTQPTKITDTQDTMMPTGKRKKHQNDNKMKPSLTMKKMTFTKHYAAQSQQPQHHTLNTPRENEAIVYSYEAASNHFMELKPRQDIQDKSDKLVTMQQQQHHQLHQLHNMKHNTVNIAINRGIHEFEKMEEHQEAHALTQQQQEEQQQQLHHQTEKQQHISQTEQLLDIRKISTTGHPGLVILISFSLFIVLLVGLLHVYRCDKPWRRHLPQQRPHQRHFNEDDTAHSFLSYHQHHNKNNNNNNSTTSSQQHTHPQLWQQQRQQHTEHLRPHLSTYNSPLHNLHVRELQKTSAVELKSSHCLQSQGGASSNDGSQNSSSLSSSSSSAILDNDDAFYIEMNPDSGQTAATLHSDLLPMELLSVSLGGSRAVNTETDATTHSSELNGTVVSADIDEHNNCTSTQDSTWPSGVKLTPTTRKFGLW